MRTLLTAALAAATIALGGCGTMSASSDIPVSEKLSPAAQVVQRAINEANVTITAAANVVTQNMLDDITPPAEGRALL